MFSFGKNGIKLLKTLHCVTAACWTGGAAALITINLHSSGVSTEGALEGMNSAAHLIDLWVVIIPGALGCLLTGLLFSLCTPWGFRHAWIMAKWVLTISCILSGTFFLGEWEAWLLESSQSLGNAALNDAGYRAILGRHLGMSVLQIAALVLMIFLSVYKPHLRKKGQ